MPEPRIPADETPRRPATSSFEDTQRALDPHRDRERRDVETEVIARLRHRGVDLAGDESPVALADLLDAIDRFDSAVEASGGDLFVDTPTAGRVEQPDNPSYVLPAREKMESVARYVARVLEAAHRLRS